MLANQVRSLMRAAWRLPQAEEGIVRIKKLAGMIECDHPAAAASLREGLEETFTINRADVPPSLHRCLATTNLIESPQSGVRKKTGNVCRWRDGEMTVALGGRSVSADREEFPEDHGLSRSLGFGIDSRPKSKRCFLSQGESGEI